MAHKGSRETRAPRWVDAGMAGQGAAEVLGEALDVLAHLSGMRSVCGCFAHLGSPRVSGPGYHRSPCPLAFHPHLSISGWLILTNPV